MRFNFPMKAKMTRKRKKKNEILSYEKMNATAFFNQSTLSDKIEDESESFLDETIDESEDESKDPNGTLSDENKDDNESHTPSNEELEKQRVENVNRVIDNFK